MVFPSPPAPEFPPDQASANELVPRYEDVLQDGRLATLAVQPALATLWNTAYARHPGARNARKAGVIALLTRLTVATTEASIRVTRPLDVLSGFQLAHDRDAAGQVSRQFMNVWASVRGRPNLPGAPVRESGEPRELVLAGEAFAEHTFTRPFGPPEQRRVTDLTGIFPNQDLPQTRYAQPAPASAAAAPEGASWLDALTADAVDTVFTLDQTDSNQHVNSLVYVRLYLAAVQRRLAAGRHPAKLRSKAFDIAYRKPSFVGDRVRAHIRLFAAGECVGGAGFIAGAGEEDRPRCYVRVVFGP